MRESQRPSRRRSSAPRCGSGPQPEVWGKTPLLAAVERGALGVVKLLRAHGADPELVDDDGRSPLQVAEEWTSRDIEAELRGRAAPGPGSARTGITSHFLVPVPLPTPSLSRQRQQRDERLTNSIARLLTESRGSDDSRQRTGHERDQAAPSRIPQVVNVAAQASAHRRNGGAYSLASPDFHARHRPPRPVPSSLE